LDSCDSLGSAENAGIFIVYLRHVADMSQSIFSSIAVSSKEPPLLTPVLAKSMHFSGFMTLKYIPKAVQDKLKRGTMKNISTIVRFE
jgi:hypothetical protein